MSKQQSDIDCRYTMTIPCATRDRLNEIAQQFHITQGEVVQVCLARLDLEAHADAFRKLRQDKLTARTARRNQLRRLRRLDPDKLDEFLDRHEKA